MEYYKKLLQECREDVKSDICPEEPMACNVGYIKIEDILQALNNS